VKVRIRHSSVWISKNSFSSAGFPLYTELKQKELLFHRLCDAENKRDIKKFLRGIEITITMLPKIKIQIIAFSEEWEQITIKAI
jgi:hypothetical protein